MVTLEEKLKKNREDERLILKRIDKRNSQRKIKCACCGNFYEIRDLQAIQTHWYTPPRGCSEGDYWSEGELQFVCPETRIINRLLFDTYDIPKEERRIYENNPSEQFKRHYKKLFKEVLDVHTENNFYTKDNSNNFENNDYVDKHRTKFGLVKKRKSS
ncbi:MAG: hypothetical protein U9Q69_00915 [Nanoarchaeota archaeon]|nr:hypothetical protein [Nanoarchaeota archaeon]